MTDSELKSIVGQNCPEYSSYSIFSRLSMGILSENCDSCSNYINGECTKNLLKELSERVRFN